MKKILIFIMVAAGFIFTGEIYAAEFGDVQIHGFVSQGFLKSDHNNFLAETEEGTYKFNEMGVNFATWLQPGFRVGAQFFSRNMGEDGEGDVVVDWAYGDYQWKEWMGIRIGRLKVVQGFYSEVRDIDVMRTSILLPQSVYPEIFRDSLVSVDGVGVYGAIPMDFLGTLKYNYQVGRLPLEADSGFMDAFAENLGKSGYTADVETITDNRFYTFGATWETPVDGLRVGSTYIDIAGSEHLEITGNISAPMPPPFPAGTIGAGTYDYSVTEFDGITVSMDYTFSDFYFIAEVQEYDITGKIDTVLMTGLPAPFDQVPISSTRETGTKGWYVFGSYRFFEDFEIGLGYSEYYPRKEDKNGDDVPAGIPDFANWLEDTYISLRWDVKKNWVAKFEYHDMEGFGAFTTAENDFSELEEDWDLIALKATYFF